MENQGIIVTGTLANIKKVEKTFDGVVQKYQTLQITILNDSGLSLIDIKDKDSVFSSDKVGKPFSSPVVYTVFNDKAYFRLV